MSINVMRRNHVMMFDVSITTLQHKFLSKTKKNYKSCLIFL